MSQYSAGVTWPVRTHAGAWDDCYDEPCKYKECNRHLWTLHTIDVMQITDTRNEHATQPKSYGTAREEVKLAM